MGLFTGLYIGQSSMMSHGNALALSADNIANSNTTGFKYQRPDFGSIVADASAGLFTSKVDGGDGVNHTQNETILTQGSVDTTGRDLDTAIRGIGYFVASDGVNQTYTRAGDFSVSADGKLILPSGEQVLGFTEASPDVLVPIQIDNVTVLPEPTTVSAMGGNLDVLTPISAAPATVPATFLELNNSSSYSTSTDVHDSLGVRHSLALHFYHTAPGEWQIQVYTNAQETGAADIAPQLLGQITLPFNEQGKLAEGTNAVMNIAANWNNGSAPSNVALDFSGLSDYRAGSYMSFLSSDGSPGGSATGLIIGEDGTVSATLDTGETTPIAELGIAVFRNPSGLSRKGDNQFLSSSESGVAEIGKAMEEQRGSMVSGALESSNVDLAREFIDVIRFQRGYQAGSQVVKTMNEVISRTLDLA